MKPIVTILLLILYVPCFSQGTNSTWGKLEGIFRTADSVMVVSHLATAGVEIYDDKTGQYGEPEPLVVKGKLNKGIIKKSFQVEQPKLDTLISILSSPNSSRSIPGSRCFIPHHAIVLYHHSKLSYIDICFSCYGFQTPIKAIQDSWDAAKWIALEKFFLGYDLQME